MRDDGEERRTFCGCFAARRKLENAAEEHGMRGCAIFYQYWVFIEAQLRDLLEKVWKLHARHACRIFDDVVREGEERRQTLVRIDS